MKRGGFGASGLCAFVLLASALLLASAGPASAGPPASKSGALVNYVTTGKLKVSKRIQILVVCSANCDVISNSRIKGPGVNLVGNVSGPLQAGVPGGPFFKPSGPLLRAMKANPGKFRLINNITATDPATGATDAISRTFRFKGPRRKGGGGGGGSNCTPGYSPCITLGSDVDCEGGGGDGPRFVQGPVTVTGSDPYGLDSDGNGIGCET
jgi:hypothetical protein